MQNDNKGFSYTYSAPTDAERREIESIRRQYRAVDDKKSKVEKLRKLHSKVTGAASSFSLISGVLGLLIFGGGMALVLEFNMIALGIILSILGLAPIIAAYPIYNLLIKQGKEKYGEEILALSDELLGE